MDVRPLNLLELIIINNEHYLNDNKTKIKDVIGKKVNTIYENNIIILEYIEYVNRQYNRSESKIDGYICKNDQKEIALIDSSILLSGKYKIMVLTHVSNTRDTSDTRETSTHEYDFDDPDTDWTNIIYNICSTNMKTYTINMYHIVDYIKNALAHILYDINLSMSDLKYISGNFNSDMLMIMSVLIKKLRLKYPIEIPNIALDELTYTLENPILNKNIEIVKKYLDSHEFIKYAMTYLKIASGTYNQILNIASLNHNTDLFASIYFNILCDNIRVEYDNYMLVLLNTNINFHFKKIY